MNEPAVREVADMTPAELGGEIRLLTQQARRMALSYAIQIGYRLKAAHEKVGPHGWAEWLKKETEFSAAAASRFEKLYEGYGTEQGSLFGVENKFPTLKNISVSNALRLLAVPEEEREEVAAELDAEHVSARELEKALAERDEARAETEAVREDAKRAAEDADRKLTDAQKRVRELESRPVEVAVERDEEAISKAAAAAKKEAETAAQKEISDLKKKLKEAEKSAKTAEEERDLAKKGAGDIEPLKEAAKKAEAEAEALRKKLAAAETGAGEAALLARMAQENFAAAMDRIERMKDSNSATAEKLLTGMERIAQALLERIREAKNA